MCQNSKIHIFETERVYSLRFKLKIFQVEHTYQKRNIKNIIKSINKKLLNQLKNKLKNIIDHIIFDKVKIYLRIQKHFIYWNIDIS